MTEEEQLNGVSMDRLPRETIANMKAKDAQIPVSVAGEGSYNVPVRDVLTTAELAASAVTNTAMLAHKAETDPHPQYVLGTEIGVSIPELEDGAIPRRYLPGSYNEVQYYDHLSEFPGVGEPDVVYVDRESRKTYMWGGESYEPINAGLALGTTSQTAGRGDWTKTAFDHALSQGNPHGLTKTDLGLGNVDDVSDADKPVSTATAAAIASASSSDRNRSNHTGQQPASSIADFATAVMGSVLSGLSVVSSVAIAATDSVLVALGKLQAQINSKLSTVTQDETTRQSGTVYAAPIGENGKAIFRYLETNDLPQIPAEKISGVLPVTHGGTGKSAWAQNSIPLVNNNEFVELLPYDQNRRAFLRSTGQEGWSDMPVWDVLLPQDIPNLGADKIVAEGASAGLPVVTGAGGVLAAAAWSVTVPAMDGTAAVGSSAVPARSDHVHPTDTSRAPSSHAHGAVTTDGKIGSAAGLPVVTGTGGALAAVAWSATVPAMDGTAAVGSSTVPARSDHVHPTDTSRAAASHSHTNDSITDSPIVNNGSGYGQYGLRASPGLNGYQGLNIYGLKRLVMMSHETLGFFGLFGQSDAKWLIKHDLSDHCVTDYKAFRSPSSWAGRCWDLTWTGSSHWTRALTLTNETGAYAGGLLRLELNCRYKTQQIYVQFEVDGSGNISVQEATVYGIGPHKSADVRAYVNGKSMNIYVYQINDDHGYVSSVYHPDWCVLSNLDVVESPPGGSATPTMKSI